MRRVTLAAITIAVAIIAGLLVGTQPAWASHGNDYDISSGDTQESRQTSFGETETCWTATSTSSDLLQAAHDNETTGSYKGRFYLWNRATNQPVANSTLWTWNPTTYIEWHPGTPYYALSSELYVKLVIYTMGGGYWDTITMDPFRWQADKSHDHQSPQGSLC